MAIKSLFFYVKQPEKLRNKVQKLADELKANTLQENIDHFGGDIMLGIGLSTKAIMDFIKTQDCKSGEGRSITEVECYFNIAAISNMHVMTALQLGELVGKEFLLADNVLLDSLSIVNKALGAVGNLFLLIQDGLDINKLVNAKNEEEKAVYTTQLVIDGAITLQMGIAMAAEEFIATTSSILLVPLMGVAVGLPALVNNYAILFQSALEVGRFFNRMQAQHKKGGYQLATNLEMKDATGKEQRSILPLAQHYMRPVDWVGIKKINFRDKTIVLEGPWIYASKSQKITGCPYVDYDKKNLFDFREGVNLLKVLSLSKDQLAIKTWLLPASTFYINYQYQQEPTIIARRDAELDTLRLLQRNKNFISDKYCFPTSYGIYKFNIELARTSITIFLDELSRGLVIPSLSEEMRGLLTYDIHANDLKAGQTVIYLNPGVSIRLYQTDENYAWVLNGQNLQQDTIKFTEKGLKINSIEIQSFLGRFQKNKRLNYVDKQGHGFILDLAQNKKILTTVNYFALQKQQQTMDQFVKYQGADPESIFRVVNYSNTQDGYRGIATYLKQRERLFYTVDVPNTLKDAILVSLQKKTAFFYHLERKLLWCTHTDSNRLRHYYAFPEKIKWVHSQGKYLLVNVADTFFYKIDTENRKSLLFALKNSNLLSFYLRMKDPASLASRKAVERVSYPECADDKDAFDDEDYSVEKDYSKNPYVDGYDNDSIELLLLQKQTWQESIEILRNHIRWNFAKAKQTHRIYQQFSAKKQLPQINENVALLITPSRPAFIWIRNETENYQLISMQYSRLEEKDIEDKDYLEVYVAQGYYLGCFIDSHRSQRVLSYFIKEKRTATSGRIYLQTVDAKQGVVSFDNTSPQQILDFAIKNAVWDKGRLIVLTTENIFKTVDAQGHTQLIGFSADWTQSHTDWWYAISVYLESQTIDQTLISVQGVTDQQGEDLIVHYDPSAKEFIVIADIASSELVYRGKIGKLYFFTQANCAYHTSGLTLEKMADLFSKEQQKMPILEKIADYTPILPLGVPTEQALRFMLELPSFFVTLHDFRMVTPYTELAFDPQYKTWQLIKIKSHWFFEQEAPLLAASRLFSRIDTDFRLKANQLLSPIPIENTPFWLVQGDRFLRTSEKGGSDNEFTYLGHLNHPHGPHYYFYGAVKKELILLASESISNLSIGYADLKSNLQVNDVKSKIAVKLAAKLEEASLLLEIDPSQVKGEVLPLLNNCSTLVLKLTSNTENNFIALPKRLFDHYARVICETTLPITILFPSKFSGTASQGKNKLVISNKHTRFIVPYSTNRALPDITLQVTHEKGNLTRVFTDTLRSITEKLNTQQTLKQIPILDYWWSKSLSEKTQYTVSKHIGNYQKENFNIDVAYAKLRDKLTGEKEQALTLFLSQLSATGIAIISATTTFLLTLTTALSYVFMQRLRRPKPTIINTAKAISISLMTRLPVAEAQTTNSENAIIFYNPANFFNAKECFVTEIGLEKLGICVNDKKLIGWLTNKAWYAVGFRKENLINDLEFKAQSVVIYHSQRKQTLSYTVMNPVSFEKIYPYIDDNLKFLLYEQVRDEKILQNFYQHAHFLTFNWFITQLSLHTPFGDIFRKVGLKVDWQQRDDSYLLARCLMTILQMVKQHHNLSYYLRSLSANLLEISMLCPCIQKTSRTFLYAKHLVRLGADYLQFGLNGFMYIPNLLDLIFAGCAGIQEVTWSLRFIVSLFTFTEDLNYWYLGVALFILPKLPFVLESLGIPVTPYVHTVLNSLSQLSLFTYLGDALNSEPDPDRLQQQNIECAHANQRVKAGQERLKYCAKSIFHFFKPIEPANTVQPHEKQMHIRYTYS
ncbi:MAG: TcdA/TcdB pore-forming domain-containing protein [Rickettsiella sp.]|nr:TcdA/TcdB pore-forming domain-containing protein [Rickettsiella sp.]